LAKGGQKSEKNQEQKTKIWIESLDPERLSKISIPEVILGLIRPDFILSVEVQFVSEVCFFKISLPVLNLLLVYYKRNWLI